MYVLRTNFIDASWQYEVVKNGERIHHGPSFDDVWSWCMYSGIDPNVECWELPNF